MCMLRAYDGSLGLVWKAYEWLKAQASKATRQVLALQWHKYMYIQLIFNEESKLSFYSAHFVFQAEEKCFLCDSRYPYNPYTQHNSHMVENVITTFEPERKKKWWQSENGKFLREDITAKCYCGISLYNCLSQSCLHEEMNTVWLKPICVLQDKISGSLCFYGQVVNSAPPRADQRTCGSAGLYMKAIYFPLAVFPDREFSFGAKYTPQKIHSICLQM